MKILLLVLLLLSACSHPDPVGLPYSARVDTSTLATDTATDRESVNRAEIEAFKAISRRIHALESENAKLRAEIERLRNDKTPAYDAVFDGSKPVTLTIEIIPLDSADDSQ